METASEDLEARARRGRLYAVVLASCATVVLATLAAWHTDRANRQEQHVRFDALATRIIDELQSRMRIYEHGLRGARGAVIAAGGPIVTHARFSEYSRSRDYRHEFPGVRGFGYIQRVAAAAEADFLRHARADDGVPDFAVRQFVPHGGDRFVIRYLEPLAGNREALGLDIASEANRRKAALGAARTGHATLTHPITLVQDANGVRHGFLLLLPIYRPGMPLDTPQQRWEATYGWSFAPLSVDAVLGELDDAEREYTLTLRDPADASASMPFYRSRTPVAPTLLTTTRTLPMYGQTWSLDVQARPAFVQRLGQTPPWHVGLAVAVVGTLAAALLYLSLLNRERRSLAAWHRARVAALVESSGDAIIAGDMHGNISHWNPAAERMFGYSASEAIGQPLRGLLAADDGGAASAGAPPPAVGGAGSANVAAQRRHRDGHVLDVLVSASPILDARGQAIGVSEILHDIGDLLRAEERFRRVVEASPSAILMVDARGVIALANLKAEELFGYPRSQLVGEAITKLLPPETRGHHHDYIQQYFRQAESRPMGAGRDLFCVHRDGRRIPVEIGLNPIDTTDGRYALASIIEISERKRAEARIMQLNATLEQQVHERTEQIRTYSALQHAILAHAGYAIIATDTRGAITLFNPAAERMLGYRADEMMGRDAGLLHDPAELAARATDLTTRHGRPVGADFAGLAAAGTVRGSDDGEWSYLRSDGTRLPVRLNLSMLRDDRGQPIGYLVMALDLTEQKLHDDQLRQAISTAEQANRHKSDFLASMSHEIRTPMNAILGMVYLLEKSDLPSAAQDMARKINRSARSLLTIINDVLDFSKIEAGRIELEDEPFDLGDVLENMAALMSSAVGTKPVEMVVSPPPPSARHLRGDAMRLSQVLINLVGNAIKFTERGEVVLSVAQLPSSEPERIRLAFSVRDTGIGIPREKREIIFSPFGQVDSSTTRRFGGTGLGLSISRRLVELMGGELRAESEPGQGSHFHFEASFAEDRGVRSADADGHAYRVLVVDDHDVARANLLSIIQGFGWSAEAVDSGQAALNAATSGGAAGYDIILMDWRMPEMDGLAAATAIRESLDSGRQPIIIMVTAFERKLLESQAGRDSVDAVLTKPATASGLFDAIMSALARRGRATARTRSGARPACRLAGLRLLVVDDSEINREVAQRILEGEGATVELAGDGQEALACIAMDAGRFDVVLMDVQMPVMDGYEATGQIRQTHAMAALPVVALTAGAFKRQQEAALAAGMNAFVAKPFEVDELVKVILRLAPARDLTLAALDKLTGSVSPVLDSPGTDEGVDPQLLDIERGLGYWREEAPYRRYLAQFARQYADAIQEIALHLRRGEHDDAAAYVHKMRGAAGSLALPMVAAITAELEHGLEQTDEALDLLGTLQIALRETLADIAEYVGEQTATEEEPPPVATAAQAAELRRLLQDLLRALDSDDPQQVEALLPALHARMPGAWMQALNLRVEEFDFRGAEHLVQQHLSGLDSFPVG